MGNQNINSILEKKPKQTQANQSKKSVSKQGKSPNNEKFILDEIEYLESILSKCNLDKFVYFIDKKMRNEQSLMSSSSINNLLRNENQIHLSILESQIKDLHLTQFAESIKYSYRNINNGNVYLVLDESDDLPSIEVTYELFQKLNSFRDSSNFILSYDKALKSQISNSDSTSNTSISSNNTSISGSNESSNKQSQSKLKKNMQITIADEYDNQSQVCHNCKIRKPIELLTKCRNKYVNRPFKIFQYFNMTLLQKNDKYYIYTDYAGDIKDLEQQLNNKTILEKHCNKYFCNFCLKGSYKTDPDYEKNRKERENCSKSTNTNQIFTTISDKANVKSDIKYNPVTKDWCCPWCVNDCFCSRCVRNEHLFRLIALYINNNGSIKSLISYISSDAILNILQKYTIPSNLTVKDGKILIRVNRSSNGKYCKDKKLIEIQKETLKEVELKKTYDVLNKKSSQLKEELCKIENELISDYLIEKYVKKERDENGNFNDLNHMLNRQKGEFKEKAKEERKEKERYGSDKPKRKYFKKEKFYKEELENVKSKYVKMKMIRRSATKRKVETDLSSPKLLNKKRKLVNEEKDFIEEIKIEEDNQKKIKKKRGRKVRKINKNEVFVFPSSQNSVFARRIKYYKKHLKKCFKQKRTFDEFRIIDKTK